MTFSHCCRPLGVTWCRGMSPILWHISVVCSVGIILFLNCRIRFMSQKCSTYFHFLFLQPLWVVIMEDCEVADSHLVQCLLRNISFFPCYQREVAVPDHRTGPARSSLLTLVRRGHLGQPFSDLQLLPEEGSTKMFQCEWGMFPIKKHWRMKWM